MKRSQLEHIIRAAGEIAGTQNVVILGSQAILGQFPQLGTSALNKSSQQILLRSMEADVLIPADETKADLIDGALGELSPFHNTYGYYAQGVDRTTALLPEGWETRMITLCNANTNHVRGHCLEIHDLMIAKLAAGRRKDYEFFEAAIQLKLVNQATLLERLNGTSLPDDRQEKLRHTILRGFRHE